MFPIWLGTSLVSLVLLSFSYFLLSLAATNGQDAAPYTIIILDLISFMFGSTCMFVYRIVFDSATLRADLKLFRWRSRATLFGCLAGLSNLIGIILLESAFYSDPASAGISVAITSGVVMIVAVVCRIVWAEALSVWQWSGIVLVMAGIAIIGAQPADSPAVLLFSLGTMVLFAISSLCFKYTKILGMPASISSVIMAYVQSVPCLLVFIIQCGRGEQFLGLENNYRVVYAFCAGLIGSCGIFLMNYSLGVGLAGVVAGICNSTGAITLLLNYLILNQAPDQLKIVGAAVIMAGVVWMSVEEPVREIMGKMNGKVAHTDGDGQADKGKFIDNTHDKIEAPDSPAPAVELITIGPNEGVGYDQTQ